MKPYPIKIRVPSRALDELSMSEDGSYSDQAAAFEREGDGPLVVLMKLSHHAHVVAQRHRTILELRTPDEADAAYYAVCSGTFQRSHFRIACRIADALRPFAKPDTVRINKAPWDRGES